MDLYREATCGRAFAVSVASWAMAMARTMYTHTSTSRTMLGRAGVSTRKLHERLHTTARSTPSKSL
jgi:hypothetical protein